MKDYDASQTLGISSENLDNVMSRISKRERNSIDDGIFKPYEPSRDIIDKFEENALKLGVDNPWEQAEGVIDGIKSLIETAPLSLEKLPEIENPFRVDESVVNLDAIASLNNAGASITGADIMAGAGVGLQNTNINQTQGATPLQVTAQKGKSLFNKPGEITFGS
jgi:hypothetical protein